MVIKDEYVIQGKMKKLLRSGQTRAAFFPANNTSHHIGHMEKANNMPQPLQILFVDDSSGTRLQKYVVFNLSCQSFSVSDEVFKLT